jgi:DNA-directed RNA polymerase specialized sigma54-like protein
MINNRLRQEDPATWLSEMLKQREEQLYEVNKEIVKGLLINHNAEDLIPMLLED